MLIILTPFSQSIVQSVIFFIELFSSVIGKIRVLMSYLIMRLVLLLSRQPYISFQAGLDMFLHAYLSDSSVVMSGSYFRDRDSMSSMYSSFQKESLSSLQVFKAFQ